MSRACRLLASAGCGLLLAACNARQTILGEDGPESQLIGQLFSLFFWVAVAVYLFVIAYLLLAIARGRNAARGQGRQGEVPAEAEPRFRTGVALFGGATMLILLGLTVATWLTDRSIAQAEAKPSLEIEVIGHQWWWEVRYSHSVPALRVRTANEIIIPAGIPVRLKLSSEDVIHSLWIPNLAGKQDLIPGRTSDLSVKAARPGLYRAQCAEFCGLQHARMALDVQARPEADFTRWYGAQLATPKIPTGGAALAGYNLFQTRQCASCHNIAGTPASGQVAPDLSHVAGRYSLAAGTLRNGRLQMRDWIADPQKVKPGNNMPKVPLTSVELDQLVAYLETLT